MNYNYLKVLADQIFTLLFRCKGRPFSYDTQYLKIGVLKEDIAERLIKLYEEDINQEDRCCTG